MLLISVIRVISEHDEVAAIVGCCQNTDAPVLYQRYMTDHYICTSKHPNIFHGGNMSTPFILTFIRAEILVHVHGALKTSLNQSIRPGISFVLYEHCSVIPMKLRCSLKSTLNEGIRQTVMRKK